MSDAQYFFAEPDPLAAERHHQAYTEAMEACSMPSQFGGLSDAERAA